MYGSIIIIVSKYAEIKKNFKFVNLVLNKSKNNPQYKKIIIPKAKKLYLKIVWHLSKLIK